MMTTMEHSKRSKTYSTKGRRCFVSVIGLVLWAAMYIYFKFHYITMWKLVNYGTFPVADIARTKAEEGKSHINSSNLASQEHWTKVMSYDGPFLNLTRDILNMTPPDFDPAFKNPCWFENSHNTNDAQEMCRRWYGPINMNCSIHTEQKIVRPLHCMPYFMVIGMSKCGTTDLYKRITDHPDVMPASIKEPLFWNSYLTKRVSITSTVYTKHFSILSQFLQFSEDEGKAKRITGEASPTTIWDVRWWWSYAENRDDEEPGILNGHLLRYVLPDVKILVTLRNPTDRLYSEYLHFKRDEHPTVDVFHTIVVTELEKFNNCTTHHSLRHCVYTGIRKELWHARLLLGLYAVFLKDWFNIFPRDQFLILQLEHTSVQQTQTLSTVYQFLNLRDVSDKYGYNKSHANERTEKMQKVGEMKNETRILLDKFYEPYNKELALLLNDKRWEY